MKNSKSLPSLLLTFFLIITFYAYAQVEVRSTSPNSVLAITSPDKAVLLPRVNNTDLVNSPEEGLFVYNKDSKTPSYHDGVQWNNLGAMMMPISDEDSLTYTVIEGYGPPFPPGGPYPLNDFQFSGSSFDLSSPGTFSFSKNPDTKTRGFMNMYFDQTSNNSTTIEIEVYKKGESNPYFAYKIKDIQIYSVAFGSANGSQNTVENYSIGAKQYGFWREGPGQSIAFNSTTQSIISYDSL